MLTIAQRLTHPVELATGSGRWRIVFTHRVLLEIEEQTGLNAMAVNFGQPSAGLMRAALYAVLREAGADVSIEDAGKLMRPAAVVSNRLLLTDAWTASFPDPVADTDRDPEPKHTEPLTTMQAWAIARYHLRLSDEEWLSMTPRMLHALSAERLEHMRWAELMNAVAIAQNVSHSFSAPKRGVNPQAFMLHPWTEEQPDRVVYGEDILAVFATLPKGLSN